jgi:hypothetical protein
VPGHQQRVAYAPDAILPDANVDAWVVKAAREMAARIAAGSVSAAR